MKFPVFRASEILDMAIQIEHQGIEFYRMCASARLPEEILKVFRHLMEQEQLHVEIFSQMKAGVENYHLPEEYTGELQSYVDSFVKDQVFHGSVEALRQADGIEDAFKAIDFGIDIEQRSILFYSAIKEAVRQSETKVIDDVISQEHGHIRSLLTLRHELERRSA